MTDDDWDWDDVIMVRTRIFVSAMIVIPFISMIIYAIITS